MGDFTIRVYKNRDYNAVRLLFAEGMLEHIPAACAYMLKLPRAQLLLFVSFITLLLLSHSYLLSLFSLVLLYMGGCHLLTREYQRYVDRCQREDLLDIEESYMASNNSCFWVAECNGRVVGMVGTQPLLRSNQVMQLRRMSVAQDQRQKGIAKALCAMVIDFARKRGFKTLTLETSVVQQAAQKLYENMGFQKTDELGDSSLLERLVNLSVWTYEYKLKDRTQEGLPDR